MGYARGCFFQHPFFKLFSQHPSLKDNFFFLNFAVKISELDVIPDSVLDSVFYLMHCTFFFLCCSIGQVGERRRYHQDLCVELHAVW